MKNLMKTTRTTLLTLVFVLAATGCIDEEEQVTPLSSDAVLSIPSVSSEASILESDADGFTVPLVLGQAAPVSTSMQVQLSSTDGTSPDTDYTTVPATNTEGIATVTLNAGDTQASLTINPIEEVGFNENKVVNLEVVSVGEGLILTDFASFSLTIVNKPVLQASEESIAFGAIDSGGNAVATFTLTGLGLLGDVTISSSSSDFSVFDAEAGFGESTTIASGAAEQSELQVTLRFNAATGELGTKSGSIILSSESADDVTISLTGKETTFTDFVSSGFEDVDLTGLSLTYTKSGVAELNNNPGEAPVDFVATGSELGFDSSFDPDNIGDDGGETIGVGGVTSLFQINGDAADVPFAYNGGTQGFHTSDLDGTLEIVFDEVAFPAGTQHLEFSVAVYLFSFDGNFDAEEGVELVWRTSAGDIPLVDIEDQIGDGNFTVNGASSFPMDQWGTVKAALDVSEAGSTGQVVIRIFNDNNDDVYLVDDITIRTAE